jgi:uncharacterized protein
MARFIYLHGFASSPKSVKAVIFRERLSARGHEVSIPPLDEGDFTGLTITRQLEVVRREVARSPGEVTLIGSSMGGYVAALFAASEAQVTQLVLMAPAFEMEARWQVRFGPEKLAEWKRRGAVPTFHFAYGEDRLIGYGLYEDLAPYDPSPVVRVPALVFMGRRDDTVDPAAVERWAARNPTARVRWLDSGHELTDQVETIWSESAAFLGLV